jgi:hypothetical protein
MAGDIVDTLSEVAGYPLIARGMRGRAIQRALSDAAAEIRRLRSDRDAEVRAAVEAERAETIAAIRAKAGTDWSYAGAVVRRQAAVSICHMIEDRAHQPPAGGNLSPAGEGDSR